MDHKPRGPSTHRCQEPTEKMGEGSLAIWLHAAGVKGVELGVMTSGMWISLFLFD